jgi:hypothetical protein
MQDGMVDAGGASWYGGGMKRWIAVLGLGIAFWAPGVARADAVDIQLAQLQQVAVQWWAGWGLTTDMPYAAAGGPLMPGCGANVRILRGYSDGLGDVMYPHGCDIRLDETFVRAAFTTHPPLGRPAALRFQISSAGLRPRGRYAARELLCSVMLHEYGHILGLPHAPTGIMREGAPAPPPVCVIWAREPA